MMRRVAEAALLCLTVRVGVAQQVRGTIRDSAGGTPIPGAVIMLLDSTSKLIARNITSETGQYVASLTSAMRQMQVLRIGFRPRIVRIPLPVEGVTRLDLTMVAIPTLLNAVSIVDQPNCSRRSDRAAALSLWEQAKAALLATVVAHDVNPAQMVRLYTDRRIDRRADTTDHLAVRIDSASTRQSFFAARPAADFIKRGFVDDSAGIRLFHSPDANVLLDASFPLGYCFELAAADRSRPREIGLGFRPASRARGRIDIEGAVWIDSVTRSLTDIVFRYIGLDPIYARNNAGGRVSFQSMTDGTSLIDRWHMRMVSLSGIGATAGNGRVDIPGIEIHERGGEVARARWNDGREWVASLGAIEGVAWYGDQPAAHAKLRLLDTDYEVLTDSAGHFRVSYLAPGPYVIVVVDSILAPLGLTLRTSTTFTAMRDTVTRRMMPLPTASDYVASTCGAMQAESGRFSAVGRVMKPDGTPASGAMYSVRVFRANTFLPYLVGRADEQGVFVVCSVERNALYNLSADYRNQSVSAVRTVVQPVEAIRLQLKEPQR